MQALKLNSRLADLDSKLTGILDQLSRNGNVSETTEPVNTLNITPSVETKADGVPSSSSNTLSSNGQNITPSARSVESQESEVPPRCPMPTNLAWNPSTEMSVGLLDHLLDQYRHYQRYFPFCIIPPEWSAADMMAERPFLLLTAITSVTCKYPQLQQGLADEVRSTLANRVIVGGENNLDLLQGLLVHLAWFQHHLVPRSQQAYRLLQIAISMLVDLGLDKCPEETLKQRAELRLRPPSIRPHGSSPVAMTNELSRVSLGCFYLSSMISSSTGKPNTLPFNDVAIERASRFEEHAHIDTDRLILPLIKLQRIVEEARLVYNHGNSDSARPRLHLHAEQLVQNLEEWKRTVPEDLWLSGLFANRFHATKIRIYEMGLVYHLSIKKPFWTTQVAALQSSCPRALISNLEKCVDSIKDYLDCFLAMDVATYDHLPLDEWMRLIIALFSLYKLSVGLPEVSGWDAEFTRHTLDLELYLGYVLERFGRLGLEERMSEISCDDLYNVLPEILQSAKESYVMIRDDPDAMHDGFRAHIDLSKPGRRGVRDDSGLLQSTGRSVCPATGYWMQQTVQTDHMEHLNQTVPPGDISEEPPTLADEDFWNNLIDSNDGPLL